MFHSYITTMHTTWQASFTLKFSNPKMSKTPMKRLDSVPGLVQELIWWTIQVKVLE